MARIRNLEDLRVDERQVGTHRDAIVEEARDSAAGRPCRRCTPRSAPNRCLAPRRPGTGLRRSPDESPCRRPGSPCSAAPSSCRFPDPLRCRRCASRTKRRRRRRPTSLWPAIGPPVCGDLAASSSSVSGARLLCSAPQRNRLAVLPLDVRDVDLPGLCGALAQHPIASRAAKIVAMPDENVPRLPSVVSLCPSDAVSAIVHLTRSYGMPSSSAAISDSDAREPPTSTVPTVERHGAVDADVQIGARLAAEVEPESARHAAALVFAERRFHVRMVLSRPAASGRCRSVRTSGRTMRACLLSPRS